MFFIIGLGLGDCKDISVKGLEVVKKCKKVYLEAYTSILTVGTGALVNIPELGFANVLKISSSLGRILWLQFNYSR